MLETQQMFLFLFKSKYRRKCCLLWAVLVCTLLMCGSGLSVGVNGGAKCVDATSCSNNGICRNESCACNDGWQGPHCEFCGGKVRLASPSGTIHDGFGNYSVGVKCSWLIDAPNSSITLHVEEFATECGWDHLYIFDGDSVESPLLGVFSGLMYKDNYRLRRVPEVVAHSGAALLHFFSDDAYNMLGFNLTYRLNGCPSMLSNANCSGHGVCIDGLCTCDGSWQGNACHLPICPNNCSNAQGHGVCLREHHRCKCSGRWTGVDCSQAVERGTWVAMTPIGTFIPPGSASAGAVVWRDTMYIVAGQSYGPSMSVRPILYSYDFNGNVWETPHLEEPIPGQRYGHSCVLYGDKIFLYGGVWGNRGATKELWAFDVSAKVWENVTVKTDPCNGTLCGPLRSAGHTATIVTSANKKHDRMVVIFGHSPHLGYLNTVQEYYFGTREWFVVSTTGYPVKGGYGHSSAYDSFTGKIYVYGGVVSENESTQVLSSKLYSYDPHQKVWTLLTNAPSARFLHTASFINPGMMIIFGGNTHNDTSHSFGAKCYSRELLAYDVLCDSWQLLTTPKEIQADLARFGHSAVVFEGSLYIYGGFDGQMLSDILKYTPGSCSYERNQTSCLNNRSGIKCVWDKRGSKCLSISEVRVGLLTKDTDEFLQCPLENRTSIQNSIKLNTQRCSALADCQSCLQTTWGCIWCGSSCSIEKCSNTSGLPVTELSQCPNDLTSFCRALHTCAGCTANPPCRWDYETHCNPPKNMSDTVQEPTACQTSCADWTSCLNCTQWECIWCQNEGRCVDKNAYTASFPYGQCREWTTAGAKCRSGMLGEMKSQCAYYATCAQCRDDPACGWCDDGSKTGLGTCMPGGYQGPNLHDHSLPSSTCPSERWHFTTCPKCQCNGHSTCDSSGNKCIQPCKNETVGHNCEKCRDGFWGSAVNGGKCQPCDCNGQATKCNHETGKCYCTTKGLTGDHCEKCDATNHYTGDPLASRGSCYYELTIDYQFTFNLSKKEDRHYTQINFRNSPIKPDVDADFAITCSVMAKINITIKTQNGPEKPLLSGHNCTTFRSRFTKSEHNFGVEDNVTQTTFFVYVYDFQPPLWIQISFSQYPKLNLQQFFITFSSCFLALLLVAAIMWKIKQKYDMYRRRQRLFVEMEQMASRPFSQVLVEIEPQELISEQTITQVSRKKNKRDAPSPIALEPCAGNRAAVLSLLVRMPTGGERYTPIGQSAGLAVASALVTLGNPRRSSIDQPKATDQGKGKGGRKTQSQHPDGCL